MCLMLCLSTPILSHSQGVPCNGEESNTLLQTSGLADLLIEISDDGNIESCRARLDPVLADLVSVAGVDWLDLVSEVV